MTVRTIVCAIVLAILSIIGILGFACYRYAYVTVPNAYAAWAAAQMVIDYMEAHDGAWPRSWDDLEKADDDLRARVDVDWTAAPDALREMTPTNDVPPFRVIWLRDGSSVHWQGREPNRMVWDYLQQNRVKNVTLPKEGS